MYTRLHRGARSEPFINTAENRMPLNTNPLQSSTYNQENRGHWDLQGNTKHYLPQDQNLYPNYYSNRPMSDISNQQYPQGGLGPFGQPNMANSGFYNLGSQGGPNYNISNKQYIPSLMDQYSGPQKTTPNMEQNYGGYIDNTANNRLNNLLQYSMQNNYPPQYPPNDFNMRNASPLRGGYLDQMESQNLRTASPLRGGTDILNLDRYYSPIKNNFPAENARTDFLMNSRGRDPSAERRMDMNYKSSFTSSRELRNEKAELLNLPQNMGDNYGQREWKYY